MTFLRAAAYSVLAQHPVHFDSNSPIFKSLPRLVHHADRETKFQQTYPEKAMFDHVTRSWKAKRQKKEPLRCNAVRCCCRLLVEGAASHFAPPVPSFADQ